MKRQVFLAAVLAALAVLGVSQAAGAQTRYDFKIPNAFVANGKTLPAGNYVITINEADDVLTVAPADAKGGPVLLGVETRIAERPSQTAPEVVFDKLNGQLYISELLLPRRDGYMVLATKEKHTHESVKGGGGK
jgi:hypothetical protein